MRNFDHSDVIYVQKVLEKKVRFQTCFLFSQFFIIISCNFYQSLTRIIIFIVNTGNLSKHKRSVHFNERPFLCDLCPSTFAFKDGLQRHRSLVHLDHRPFVCKNCGADFKQVSQLRKHTCAQAGSSSTRGRS